MFTVWKSEGGGSYEPMQYARFKCLDEAKAFVYELKQAASMYFRLYHVATRFQIRRV